MSQTPDPSAVEEALHAAEGEAAPPEVAPAPGAPSDGVHLLDEEFPEEDGEPSAGAGDDPYGEDRTIDLRDSRIHELESRVEELQARLRAVSSAYQKQQDEVGAARARLERQAAVQEELRRGEVVAALFEPVENLRRSLDALRKGGAPEDNARGLELILQQFMSSFQRLGLEEVPGRGARFDPTLHEALTLVPVNDPALDQVVIEVFARGYRIGSRLIAPAKVVVGQLQEPVADA